MKRIALDNVVFEGENNAYLLVGEGPTTLVDTGVPTPAARGELEASLANEGVRITDLDQLLLTHYHWDHAGLAGEIAADADATVRIHPDDAEMLRMTEEQRERNWKRHRDRLSGWGTPDDAIEELLAFMESLDEPGTTPDVDPFQPGDRIPAGDRELTVKHFPGHTVGQCGFAFRENGARELLSGDALLPKYTPNVGGADLRVERPLAKYLDTLARIADGHFDRAWPGHRDPIEDPAGRAGEIVAHHRDRAENVLAVLSDHGPADPWTVGAHLFGDLSGIHVLHGPGEAAAHLDHLADHGVLDREDGEYALTTPDPSLDPLFPEMD